MNENHRFGIEVEFNTPARDFMVVDALRHVGLSASSSERTTNRAGEWCVKYDGSIGRGWEIVSPILAASEVAAKVALLGQAFHYLRTDMAQSVRAGMQCGLHVHLSGAGEDGLDMLRNLARRWCNFEDTLDLMQPPSRRDSRNSFCRSNLGRFGSWGQPAALRAAAMWDALGECESRDELIQRVSPDRYFKLNLQSLYRHGTVEFRHHGATVSARKILHWVTFVSHFADTSAQAARVWRRTPDDTQPERFRKLMRGVPLRTRTYLAQRVRTLNDGQFPGELATPEVREVLAA